MSNSNHRPRPPRYKLALLTWVGAYAVITLILQLLGPTMADWPLAMRTLAISALMVAGADLACDSNHDAALPRMADLRTPPAPAPCAEEGMIPLTLKRPANAPRPPSRNGGQRGSCAIRG